MLQSNQTVAVPASVRLASRLMLSYAVLVLIGTLSFAYESGFSEVRELFRGLLRVAGMSGLAFWLLTLDKRAYWFSVIACIFLAGMGIIGAILVTILGVAQDGSLLWIVVRFVTPIYLLGHAAVLLIKRETRDAFPR